MKKPTNPIRSTACAVYASQFRLKSASLSVLTRFILLSPSMIHLKATTEVIIRVARIKNQRKPVMKAFDAGMRSLDKVPAKPEKFPGIGKPG